MSWEPPAEGTRNGQITGYKIRYKPRGERGAGDSVTTDGSRRSFELNGEGSLFLLRNAALRDVRYFVAFLSFAVELVFADTELC